MLHIAASEVKQRLGQYMESALTEPVVIEKPCRVRIAYLFGLTAQDNYEKVRDAYPTKNSVYE